MATYKFIKPNEDGTYSFVDGQEYADLIETRKIQGSSNNNWSILKMEPELPKSSISISTSGNTKNLYIDGWKLKIDNKEEMEKWLLSEYYQKINNIIEIIQFNNKFYLTFKNSEIDNSSLVNNNKQNQNLINDLLQRINGIDFGIRTIHKC